MTQKYRSNFSAIVAGYSQTSWRDKLIYFKHFTNCELGFFELDEDRIYNHAQSQGLLSEKEKIDLLKIDDIWTEAQERELRQERDFLELQLTTKKNLLLESQIKNINKQIEDSQKKIYDIIVARNQLVGFTVENFTARKVNELHMQRATYKDAGLSELFFTKESFDELEDSELEELITLYNECLNKINTNIKKLAISPFFQSIFNLSAESVYEFYGKPVIGLTTLQQDLYIFGRYFGNLLKGENPPSQEMLDDPDKLIEQHQKNMNMKSSIGEVKGDLGAGTTLGAKKSEYEAAGIKGRYINFRSKLKPGQTELSSVELANIFNGR